MLQVNANRWQSLSINRLSALSHPIPSHFKCMLCATERILDRAQLRAACSARVSYALDQFHQYATRCNITCSVIHQWFDRMKKVCLKSETFQGDLAFSFQRLRSERDFTDVTLVTEDGQHFVAHRVILAAMSPVLETIFKRSHHPQPLLYLRGVNSPSLEHLLLFLYQGEFQLPEDQLSDFLAFAKEFEIKGLVEKPDSTAAGLWHLPNSQAVFVSETSGLDDDPKVEITSKVDEKLRHIFKSEEPRMSKTPEQDADVENAEKQSAQQKKNRSSQSSCLMCDFKARDKWHINRHMNAKHPEQTTTVSNRMVQPLTSKQPDQGVNMCMVTSCGKVFDTVEALKIHKETCYMQCVWPNCGIR